LFLFSLSACSSSQPEPAQTAASSSAGSGGSGGTPDSGTPDGGTAGSQAECEPAVGTPEEMASGIVGVRGLAVNETHVFVASATLKPVHGAVSRLPLSGGPLELLGEQTGDLSWEAEVMPFALALTTSKVFWFDYMPNVGMMPIDGGAPSIRYEYKGYVSLARGDAFGPDAAYVATDGAVMRVPLPSGTATPLDVTFPSVFDTPDLLASKSFVYAVTDGQVVRVPSDGTGPALVMTAPFEMFLAGAADDDAAYVSTFDGLLKFTFAEGATPIQFPDTAAIHSMAIDDQYLYFADGNFSGSTNEPSTVWRVKKDGTCPTALATSDRYVDGLTVADTHLYWFEHSGSPATGVIEPATPSAIVRLER
jgi:hypothetical protein